MGLFAKLFGGSEKMDMGADPNQQGLIDQLANYNPGGGAPKNFYKDMMKKYSTDPVSLAAGAATAGAIRRSNIDTDYMTGGNQLMSQVGGGDNVALLQRMHQVEAGKADQDTAMNIMNQSDQKGFEAAQGLEGIHARIAGNYLTSRGTALGGAGNYYSKRFQMGQTNGIVPALSGAAKAVSSFL